MRLSAALEYEKLRESEESWNKILLNKDGKFYHIYDWSAWLLCCVVSAGEGREAPKAQRYTGKDKQYVMLGFPLTSLSKYLPNYKDVKTLEEDDLLVEVELPDTDGLDYSTLQAAFSEWYEQVPISDKKAKSQREVTSGAGQASALGRSGLFHIVSQILSYPVESSTPAQNIEFISSLRQQVAALL